MIKKKKLFCKKKTQQRACTFFNKKNLPIFDRQYAIVPTLSTQDGIAEIWGLPNRNETIILDEKKKDRYSSSIFLYHRVVLSLMDYHGGEGPIWRRQTLLIRRNKMKIKHQNIVPYGLTVGVCARPIWPRESSDFFRAFARPTGSLLYARNIKKKIMYFNTPLIQVIYYYCDMRPSIVIKP